MLIPEIDFCTSEHVRALEYLELHCFPEAPWSFHVLQRDLHDTSRDALFYLGAFWKGFLVGYAVFRPRGREWDLLRIGVQESHRGHSVGRQLLEAGEILAEEARAESLYLEVREENRRARNLYESSGYLFQGPAERMYRDTGRAALGYRKKLGIQELPEENIPFGKAYKP